MEEKILINGRLRTKQQCNAAFLFLFKITVRISIAEYFKKSKELKKKEPRTGEELVQALMDRVYEHTRTKKGD